MDIWRVKSFLIVAWFKNVTRVHYL